MEAYVTLSCFRDIGGLVIWRRNKKSDEIEVLLGLRSPLRAAPNQWCLPTGEGALRTDLWKAFMQAMQKDPTLNLEDLFKNPMLVIRNMPSRQRQLMSGPPGFAKAEAEWYLDLRGKVRIENLKRLRPICQDIGEGTITKHYYAFEWTDEEIPMPAEESDWPFQKVQFFSEKELTEVPVAFGCDKDLAEIFWPL